MLRARTRLPAGLAGAALLAVAGLGACSADKSFALVTVLSAHGEFSRVTQFWVTVKNDSNVDQLEYPKAPSPLRFNETEGHTFSVSFDASLTGLLEIGIKAVGLNEQNVPNSSLGYGDGSVAIDPAHTVKLTILIRPGASPPDAGMPQDAAAVDRVSTDAGANRDAALMCEPTAPSATCGAGSTCIVCQKNVVAGMCTKAGGKTTGELCDKNEDCVAGTQCFEFGCTVGGKTLKTCMQFCKDDRVCGAGARCATNVPCGAQASGFKLCSQPCDPRGAATTGCAAGLHCFIFPGEIPDCDCATATRTSAEGTSCRDALDCQPGLLCVSSKNVQTCRRICRLDAPDCTAGRMCEKLENPNYTTFGACLLP